MRKILYIFLFCVLWIQPAAASPRSLKYEDISRVMDRFFTFHIENKQLNTTIVRRSMKLYIEHFDPERAYLLHREIKPFLEMSEARALEVLNRLERNDYSDFFALNRVIQKSITRAQRIRQNLQNQLIKANLSDESPKMIPPSKYSRTEKELFQRQRNRMVRFYLYHEARTQLGSLERKAKVYHLFERKAQRIENNYLFLSSERSLLSPERVEYLLTLRILKAFAKSLDTHSSFFSPEEAFEMRMTLEKHFEGVGVVLAEGVDGVMIAEIIKGSPAELSGKIQINDLLVEINGEATNEVPFEEVLQMLKKTETNKLVLGFKRLEAENNRFFRVPLLKRAIVMHNERIQIGYDKVDGGVIGKIKLHSFYESSGGISSEKDIKNAIQSFRQKGDLVGLVLDLRENSGGFLSQAVKVAGLFVSNGVIVISKYGQGEKHYLRNIASKAYFNGPLVILTSKMSASASEIVAQALQDYGVAVVVGDERTFGKGSIQYQTVTDAKADMFFKVTVGRYYTASGKSTQIDGVIADIVVPTQYAPYKIGEKYLDYPLPPDRVQSAFVDPLTDLDERARRLFQMRYLPHAQRVVSFWKKRLPELRKKSAYRLAHHPGFQKFKQKLVQISSRSGSLPPNTVDEQIQMDQDLQMMEALNIVKDMIILESQAQMPQTGTD